MKLWHKLLAVFIVILLLGLKILQNSESRAAIRTGTVPEFWYVLCGVDVNGSLGDPGWMAGPDAVRGDWAYYSIAGYCGEMYYRVRLSDAAVELPHVIQLVNAKRQEAPLPLMQERAMQSWSMRDGSADDVARLVHAMLEARLKHIEETAPERVQYVRRAEQMFDAYLKRSTRYWKTLLFEFVWLSGVVLLVAAPWLRSGGRLLWSVCLGIAPLVLFFPVYCGYGDYTFSSCFPDGGVFYPDVLRQYPVIFSQTQIDSWLVARCPPLFDSFAQNPRGKDMDAFVHFPPPGPVGICLTGLGPAIMLYILLLVARTLSRRKRC